MDSTVNGGREAAYIFLNGGVGAQPGVGLSKQRGRGLDVSARRQAASPLTLGRLQGSIKGCLLSFYPTTTSPERNVGTAHQENP